MKKGILIGLGAAISFLMACGDGNVIIQEDPDIQLEKDSIAIAAYLSEKGYDDYKITDTGTRYIILEEGDGLPIDESDIVSFDYTGILLSDTIFDTSIKSVGDSIRAHFLQDSVGLADKSIHQTFLTLFSQGKVYAPLTYTYSSSGWTINEQFITGFSDGVTETFKEMNVGGKSIIIIPSGIAYGTRGNGTLIAPNTPILFELYPTKVIKQ
ncbi:FKBP-type peptidyl-prolyl cis-trans isomerase [Ekhidna sp.]|uniref:FKBP-type peptidyl-prolyl cis-trans isomerase n=1 Tax=Ekhidna sp. TaxID=2608089 RepID=UPI003CCC081E